MLTTASSSRVSGGSAALSAVGPAVGSRRYGVARGGHVDDRPSQPGPFAMAGALTGLSMLIAVLVAGSMALGYLLDEALSTPHVFLFVGLVAGVAAAALATRSLVARYFRS
jgi:hypothetical protein